GGRLGRFSLFAGAQTQRHCLDAREPRCLHRRAAESGSRQPDALRRHAGYERSRRPDCVFAQGGEVTHDKIPTTAPIREVESVPDTIDFTPSDTTSSRRSGAMVARPAIMMPRLPKLAKPHMA